MRTSRASVALSVFTMGAAQSVVVRGRSKETAFPRQEMEPEEFPFHDTGSKAAMLVRDNGVAWAQRRQARFGSIAFEAPCQVGT